MHSNFIDFTGASKLVLAPYCAGIPAFGEGRNKIAYRRTDATYTTFVS
ncbi:hypothetical protein [Corynebacterium propinquum]|nr:hypothetical protein [Corynebacterium propinquum]